MVRSVFLGSLVIAVSSSALVAVAQETPDIEEVAQAIEAARGGENFEAPDGSVNAQLPWQEQVKACEHLDGGTTRLLVTIEGVNSDEGNVRVQTYGNNPETFLQSGMGLANFDVPSEVGDIQVCVSFDAPGDYAIAIMHDKNANGRFDVMKEGFGFSNNPSVVFSQPDYDEAAFSVSAGLQEMQVSMNYVFEDNSRDRRRRARR